MDSKRLLSWSVLLFLSLAFKLSYGTGGDVMNCPTVLQQLGNDTLLPLTYERMNKSMNKSIRIVVTMATSPESSIKKKIVSLNLPEGSAPGSLEKGYQFHLENLSLGILGSRRDNEGWYFMSLEDNVEVRQFCVQLKLHEQVSMPEIKVLNRTREKENGTCSLLLACVVENREQVTYSWSNETGASLPSPANSSHLLYITLDSQNADGNYTCTVSNPISSRSKTFNPKHECRSDSSESRSWVLYATLLLLMGIASFIIIPTILIMQGRKDKTNRCQSTKEENSLTIYAQVQKPSTLQKKSDDLSDQDPCTTIYVAATEPVSEPAPGSAQESNPITVYASVTLPES